MVVFIYRLVMYGDRVLSLMLDIRHYIEQTITKEAALQFVIKREMINIMESSYQIDGCL